MEKKTLYRYFGNCATEEERIQVLEWTKASPENLKEFCRERNIYNAILLSTDNIQRTKYDFRRHYRAQLLRIAAVVILLLSVAFGSFYLTMGDRIVPLYSLTVPAGNSNTLLLPDGTKVWLNAGSTIKYPSSFWVMIKVPNFMPLPRSNKFWSKPTATRFVKLLSKIIHTLNIGES